MSQQFNVSPNNLKMACTTSPPGQHTAVPITLKPQAACGFNVIGTAVCCPGGDVVHAILRLLGLTLNCWLITQTKKSQPTQKGGPHDPNQYYTSRQQAG